MANPSTFLKKMATHQQIGGVPSKRTLNRSKTGAVLKRNNSSHKIVERDRSFSMPKEDEAISQVINFVSKRFITHQGVVKETRQQKKERLTAESSNEYVSINVSGVTFKTKLETLARYPNTLLG